MAVRADGRISQPSLLPDPLPALLTVEEAAELLRIGRTKAYAMAREWRTTGGRSGLPVVDFGDLLRVPLTALEDRIGASLSVSRSAPVDDPPAEAPAPSGEQSRSETPRRGRRRPGAGQLGLFGPA